MDKYENTCDRLDTLALRNLHLSNDLIRLKLDLDSRLRDGWLALAKTRYVAGFHRIGKVSLPDYDLADVSPTEYGPKVVIDLESYTSPVKTDGDEQQQQHEIITTKFTLHQIPSENGDEKKSKEEVERELLKRFGGLTPPSVKQGQRAFGTVLQLVSEIASVQSELNAMVEEYRGLMELKTKYDRER